MPATWSGSRSCVTRNRRSTFCLIIILQLSFHSPNLVWWYMRHIKSMHCACITYLQSNLFGVPFPNLCLIGHQARKLDKLPTWAWTIEGSINSKFVFLGVLHMGFWPAQTLPKALITRELTALSKSTIQTIIQPLLKTCNLSLFL